MCVCVCVSAAEVLAQALVSEKGPADVYLHLLQFLVSTDDGVEVVVKGRGHTSWEELAKKHVYQLDKTSVRLVVCVDVHVESSSAVLVLLHNYKYCGCRVRERSGQWTQSRREREGERPRNQDRERRGSWLLGLHQDRESWLLGQHRDKERRELVARSTERELAEFRLYLLERLMEEAIVKVLKVCTGFTSYIPIHS